MNHAAPLAAALLLAAPLISGCAAPRPPENPAAVAADDDASANQRARAIEALAQRLDASPESREPLKRRAWARNDPHTVRAAAVRALLEDDPDDTRAMLALMLPTEPSPSMVELIATLAAERRWTDLTAPLVRSWARPLPGVPEGERPEPPAVAALHPGQPVADAVFDVFATPRSERAFNEKERRAAWEVLGLLDPTGEAAAARLAALPPAGDDPTLAAVRDAAVGLGAVPVTQEQLEWLERLRAPEHRAFWNRAKELATSLTPEQREGLALRHAAALVVTDGRAPQRLTHSRAELLSQLRTRLGSRTVTPRSADGARDAAAESLAGSEDRLAYADILHVLAIDDALRAPHNAADLFAHADRDHNDESTEHGGVLAPSDDVSRAGVEPVLYPPRPAQRLSDKKFVAPAEMFTKHPDALAHFHFHAHTRRNARYAGPGPGDRAYADAFGRASVVLTFLDENTLAADYYHPNGLTLDLGRITRPDK